MGGRHGGMAGLDVDGDVFTVGMSRSGTTWLARALNRHPEIAVFGESAFWGRKHVPPAEEAYAAEECREVERAHDGRMSVNDVAPELGGPSAVVRSATGEAAEEAEPVGPGELYRRVCARVGRAEGARIVVEKTPHHVLWVDRIEKHVPGARFLVCVRDPRGFLRSYKHQGERKPPPVRETFEDLYHPVVTALVARQYLRAIRSVLDTRPDRTRMVRLEEIEDDPDGVLRDVQRFLGVEVRAGLDRGTENTSFPGAEERPELDPAELFWLDVVAGRASEALGYPRRSPRPVRLRWIVPLLTLPVALLRVLSVVRGATVSDLGAYLRGWIAAGDSETP